MTELEEIRAEQKEWRAIRAEMERIGDEAGLYEAITHCAYLAETAQDIEIELYKHGKYGKCAACGKPMSEFEAGESICGNEFPDELVCDNCVETLEGDREI